MHDSKGELSGLIHHIRQSGELTPPLFRQLLQIVEGALKSNPAFYYRKRTEEEYKDIVMQVLEKFYHRINEKSTLLKPYAYLQSIITNHLRDIDVTFHNKHYLHFKKVLWKLLNNAAGKGEIIFDGKYTASADGNAISGRPSAPVPGLIRLVESFDISNLRYRYNLTGPVKEALAETMLLIINAAPYKIEFKILCNLLAERIGITVSYPLSFDRKEWIRIRALPGELPNAEVNMQVKDITQHNLQRIKKEWKSLDSQASLYSALWQNYLFRDESLKELALRFGYKTPNNIVYYLKKYGIEKTYVGFLRNICDIAGTTEFSDVHRYAVALFQDRIKNLFAEDNGGIND